MSLLISVDALCILANKVESPITLAALRTSLQVSSNRWIQRTINPEKWEIRLAYILLLQSSYNYVNIELSHTDLTMVTF